MGINYPGGIDSFSVPTDPEDTPLSEAGSSNRNHVQWHQDAGTALVALESNAAQLGHDHSGSVDISIVVEQTAAGSVALDDIQTITLTGTPTGGSFTLVINDQLTIGTETTSSIAYNATGATVQSALTALIGVGNVTVTGGAGGPYTVTFTGELANSPQPTLQAISSITGGGVNVTHTQIGSTGGGSVQVIVPSNTPTGGSFYLTFKGQTTAPIVYNASNVTVQGALQSLSTIGANNVSVVGQGPYTVTFTGSLAGTTQPLISAASQLVSGLFATQQLSQVNTHQNADTDSATTAIHHTIGPGANQAAAGNHVHDYNGPTIINKPYIICTSASRPPNPVLGEMIYETDTNRSRVWASFPGNVLQQGMSFADAFNRTSGLVSGDAYVGNTAGSATSIVATLGISASATALVVGLTCYSSAAPWHSGWTTTVECGNTPMVQLGIIDNPGSLTGWTALYGLIGPPTGTQSVTATVSNSSNTADLEIVAASYINVGAFGVAVTNAGALGFGFPAIVPSGPGDMAVAIFGGGQGALSAPTGGTVHYNNYAGNPYVALALMDAPGITPTTTLSMTSAGLTNSSIGVNLIVNSSNLGTNYSQYYPTGSSVVGGTMGTPVAGQMQWIKGQNVANRVIAQATGSNMATTLSDGQDIAWTTGTVMGSQLFQQSPTVDMYLRMSSNGQSYVRLSLNTSQAVLSYTTTGPANEAVLASAYTGTLSTNIGWEIKANGRTFTLYRGGVQTLVFTDQSSVTALGPSNRGWGVGMSAAPGYSYQIEPSTITALSINDLPIYGTQTLWQLTSLGSVPYVRAETHVGQVIAVNNVVSAFWDTVVEDIFGFFGQGNIANETGIAQTTGITITEPGHYDGHASVPWDPAYPYFDHTMVGLTVNGQDIGRKNLTFMRGNGYSPGFAQTNEIYMHWHFAAGDVLRVVVSHNASSQCWLYYNPLSPNMQMAQVDLKFTGP